MVQLANDITDRIEQLADTVGDGTGTTSMTHSDVGGIEYFVKPPSGYAYDLARMNIIVRDAGNFRADFYGASAALTNGIIVAIKKTSDDSVLKTLTPHPIKEIGDWHLVAGTDMLYTNFQAGTHQVAAVRWTFSHGGGSLILRNGIEYLSFLTQDAMNGLVEHIAQVQGKRRAWPP